MMHKNKLYTLTLSMLLLSACSSKQKTVTTPKMDTNKSHVDYANLGIHTPSSTAPKKTPEVNQTTTTTTMTTTSQPQPVVVTLPKKSPPSPPSYTIETLQESPTLIENEPILYEASPSPTIIVEEEPNMMSTPPQEEPLFMTNTITENMVTEPTVMINTPSYEQEAPSYSQYSQLTGDFQNNYALQNFIDRMVNEHGFDRNYLNQIFSQAQNFYYIPQNRSSSSRVVQGGAWDRYKSYFIYEKNIQRGIKFWNEHREALARAEAEYGVPAEYIVGIIGIETAYGTNFGKHRVIDVLTTKAMSGGRRSAFYTDELEKFLLISRDIGLDPTEVMGSTSGALGYGQFMPSSYIRFAVDFNHDGHKDLWDPEDAIGSIANYFSQNGWNASIPQVAVRAKYKGYRFRKLKTGYKTKYSLNKLQRKYKIKPRKRFTPYSPVSLIKLERGNYDELWLGSHNFRVITTYNHSSHYAMAVHQLAKTVKARRN